MSNINDKIRQIAKETEPELIHIRRELHQYPELGIDLPKTHEIISRELHKIPGLKIREHVAGGYGLIAELQGKKEQGKNVLLRADIDALPLEDYRKISPVFEEDIYKAIDLETCVNKRVTIGAPGKDAMAISIAAYQKYMEEY